MVAMSDMATDTLLERIETLEARLSDAHQALEVSEVAHHKVVHAKDKEIHSLHRIIDAFQEDKRLAQAQRFGASSEKDHPQQWLFDEAELGEQETEEPTPSNDNTISVKPHQRRGGRTPLPKNLLRIEVIHDIDEAQKVCSCGCSKERIGEDVSEQIDIIPAKVRVIKHIRPKYSCKRCSSAPEQAAMPAQPIPKSQASPGFLAYVVTSKYADALPLYRQCHILKRSGIDYARNTLCHQVVKAGQLIQPLINLLEETALNYPVLQMDETTVQVLREPNKAAQSKSYMWVMRGGPPGESSIIYHYDPGRGQAVPKRLLEGYRGYLQTDAWHAYDAVHGDNVTAVACWAHARRKFKEAEKALPKAKQKKAGRIQQAVSYIQKLYAVEKRHRLSTPHERLLARKEDSLPVLKDFKIWLDKQNINPESRLGKAISYTLNCWDRLQVYCTDGRIEIDNNGIENKIRPFAIGRKNWMCVSRRRTHDENIMLAA